MANASNSSYPQEPTRAMISSTNGAATTISSAITWMWNSQS
ncbi:hypothetical protein [Nonomuraea sp. NPDC048901]